MSSSGNRFSRRLHRSRSRTRSRGRARYPIDGELPLAWATTPLLLARGRLHAAAGNHAAAIGDLGGVAVATRARSELTIAGARSRRAATRGRDALTPSELRVAQLAAAGRTNREIAESLFLTLRTVEPHLTNSYAKLGITSRRQLSARLDTPAD